ncbi:MAG: hypothetical protein ACRC62_28345 [Microcoleus sp.]
MMLTANNSRNHTFDRAAVSNSQGFWELLTARFESQLEGGPLADSKQMDSSSIKPVGVDSLKIVAF